MSWPKWKVLSSKEIFKTGFFRLRADECQLPDQRIMPRYFVMEFADWVNVVPITKDKKVLLIHQYRNEGEGLFYEIPGGTTHPGGNEDPLEAARRELKEETGYEAKNWKALGFHYPNPALQSNRMHTYIAYDCVKMSGQDLDEFEQIKVVPTSIEQVIEMLKTGKIKHSLMAASLVLALGELESLVDK